MTGDSLLPQHQFLHQLYKRSIGSRYGPFFISPAGFELWEHRTEPG